MAENYIFASGKRSLLDLFDGADHLLAAQQFWTGETRHGPNFPGELPQSRPHDLVRDLEIPPPCDDTQRGDRQDHGHGAAICPLHA